MGGLLSIRHNQRAHLLAWLPGTAAPPLLTVNLPKCSLLSIRHNQRAHLLAWLPGTAAPPAQLEAAAWVQGGRAWAPLPQLLLLLPLLLRALPAWAQLAWAQLVQRPWGRGPCGRPALAAGCRVAGWRVWVQSDTRVVG